MPQFPFTASELYDASLLHEMAMAIDDDEGSDDDVVEALMYAAAEPFYRQRLQDIGPEHLSIARLWRTFTGGEGDQSGALPERAQSDLDAGGQMAAKHTPQHVVSVLSHL